MMSDDASESGDHVTVRSACLRRCSPITRRHQATTVSRCGGRSAASPPWNLDQASRYGGLTADRMGFPAPIAWANALRSPLPSASALPNLFKISRSKSALLVASILAATSARPHGSRRHPRACGPRCCEIPKRSPVASSTKLIAEHAVLPAFSWMAPHRRTPSALNVLATASINSSMRSSIP